MKKLFLDKEELAKMKGTWQVININLPDVLAEKEGVRKVFQYFDSLLGHLLLLLSKEEDILIKPGWIIEVDEYGYYSFFPPLPPATAPGSTSK